MRSGIHCHLRRVWGSDRQAHPRPTAAVLLQGNWAGPIGASAALALGFYHSLSCVSSQPLHVWDVMPADLVVNCILAAAAAVAADAAATITAAAAASRSSSAGHPPSSSSGQDHDAGSSSSAGSMLIFQSSSSSTFPMTLMEGWNAALEFLAVHPLKLRLCWGLPAAMTPAFRPDPAAVRRQRRWIALKVWLACLLLR